MAENVGPKAPTSPPKRSSLEEMLQLASLPDAGPDQFTTTQELWHPPGGRGLFGGVPIALSLSAAQRTVPSSFSIHSIHCYFLLTGDSKVPCEVAVQRVRDGKSFATRTALVTQKGKCIFTCTMSFTGEASSKREHLSHGEITLDQLQPPPEEGAEYTSATSYAPRTVPIDIENYDALPQDKRIRMWLRAPDKILQGGSQIQQVVLAFMSDWNLISGVPISHKLWKFPEALSLNHTVSPLEGSTIGMLSSLNHTMFFHQPHNIQTNEWMLLELSSSWSGGERGLATSKIYSKQGALLATCIQEGVVRLRRERMVPETKI